MILLCFIIFTLVLLFLWAFFFRNLFYQFALFLLRLLLLSHGISQRIRLVCIQIIHHSKYNELIFGSLSGHNSWVVYIHSESFVSLDYYSSNSLQLRHIESLHEFNKSLFSFFRIENLVCIHFLFVVTVIIVLVLLLWHALYL